MKDKIKKLFAVAGAILLIIGFNAIGAYSDYSWADDYIRSKKDNYILYKQFDNYSDIAYIYTLFKTPVTRIILIDRKATVKKGNGIYYIRTLTADKELGGGGVKEDTISHFIDCANRKNGWMPGGKEVENADTDTRELEWSGFNQEENGYPEAEKHSLEECRILEDNF